MPKEVKTKKFQDLPNEVTDFLTDIEGFKFAQEFTKKHNLPKEKVSELLALNEDIALGKKTMTDLPKELGSNEVAVEFATKRLLPIAGVIGDVAGQIVKWGGNVEELKKEAKVVMPEITAESFVAGALKEFNAQMEDKMLQHRLELIIVSYVKGVREINGAIAVMTRKKKVGGLEMGEEEAHALLKAIDEKLAFIKISFKEEKENVGAVPLAGPVKESAHKAVEDLTVEKGVLKVGAAPMAGPVEKTGAIGTDIFSEEDEEEITRMKTRIGGTGVNRGEQGGAGVMEPEKIKEAIIKESNLKLDDEMTKRFKLALDSRLKDLRDAYETRAHIELPAEEGGLGLSGSQLAETIGIIEKYVSEYQKAVEIKSQKEKSEIFAKKKHEEQDKAESKKQAEQDALNKKYAALTGVPASAPEPKIPSRQIKATVSAQTIQNEPGAKPKVQDIRFERRLSGPIEEIRNLSIKEFRRLSADPKQAATKIKDKITLLEAEGYDKKIKGIKAWRESPLHQQYVKLSSESLSSGKSIINLIKEKEDAGEEVPTQEELNIIMSLNAELKF